MFSILLVGRSHSACGQGAARYKLSVSSALREPTTGTLETSRVHLWRVLKGSRRDFESNERQYVSTRHYNWHIKHAFGNSCSSSKSARVSTSRRLRRCRFRRSMRSAYFALMAATFSGFRSSLSGILSLQVKVFPGSLLVFS